MTVGDPGSGKSTFLKYIVLVLACSYLNGNASLALEKLSLPEPLPVPIFLTCWDLADFIRERNQSRLEALVEFVAERLSALDFLISTTEVETLLDSGNCCRLFDGLDKVTTNVGRSAVSHLASGSSDIGMVISLASATIQEQVEEIVLGWLLTDIEAGCSTSLAESVPARLRPDVVGAEPAPSSPALR